MVTGWPDVKETPYMGAVVLYLVRHNLDGVEEQAVIGASLRDRPMQKYVLSTKYTKLLRKIFTNLTFCRY